MTFPLGVSPYYELVPEEASRAGDIYRGLPSLGLLTSSDMAGVVITPACDLANCKTESISYLPVVSVETYLTSYQNLRDLRSRTNQRLAKAGIEALSESSNAYALPSITELESKLALITSMQGEAQGKKGNLSQLTSASAGVSLLKSISTGTGDRMSHWRILMGPECHTIIRRLVRNETGATHFLIPDGHDPSLSAIVAPSVALLRHPLTLPIEILEGAQSRSEEQWEGYCDSIAHVFPVAKHCRTTRPLKTATLKEAHLKDLIARFVSLYVRLGSPDLSTDEIDRYVNDLAGEENG